MTDEGLVCDAVLSIDDQVLAQWHTGYGDCKIWYDLPSHVLSEDSHRAHLHLNPMTTTALCLRRSARAHLWLQTYSTDYEPTRDFREQGAGFRGTVLFVNQTRGTITDTGFVTTPPLFHDTHQLWVSLFDQHDREIEFSTSASITIHLSPHATASVGDAGVSRVHGASRLGKAEDENEGGSQVVWLTLLVASWEKKFLPSKNPSWKTGSIAS